MSRDAYAEAGVDIDAADTLVDRIKPLARATHRPGVLGGIGGFGGLFALGRYTDPVLVSGTDGVGTKLLVAQRVGRHDSIGIDLVAMCVNDIAVTGAEPLFFLDYFATGKLSVDEAEAVVRGIAEGCLQAGCALLGGETAEMPGMYQPGHYDLAGFAVGVVERDAMMDGSSVGPGHVLVALPSSGLHSNGYSLVRKLLVDVDGADLDAPSEVLGCSLAEELLRPTRIYAKELLELRATVGFDAASHITGGGLPGNVPRVLPAGLGARIERGSWPMPPIFDLLRSAGALSESDLAKTFNLGVGMVLVVAPDRAEALAAASGGYRIGTVVEGAGVQFDG
ncbi:MAG: phosphoribosylformylglycinamidine cyclo-ligase [Myxococcota bacterium]|jgi:phosphoribosylformylglycinamidine cyclo-ligase